MQPHGQTLTVWRTQVYHSRSHSSYPLSALLSAVQSLRAGVAYARRRSLLRLFLLDILTMQSHYVRTCPT